MRHVISQSQDINTQKYINAFSPQLCKYYHYGDDGVEQVSFFKSFFLLCEIAFIDFSRVLGHSVLSQNYTELFVYCGSHEGQVN